MRNGTGNAVRFHAICVGSNLLAEKAAPPSLLMHFLGQLQLAPAPQRLLVKNAKRMVRGSFAFAPRPATFGIEPTPALTVAPRRVVHALVSFDVLQRRHRELDLRHRVDPRHDRQRIRAHSDARLGKLVSQPSRELVSSLSIHSPRPSEWRVESEVGRHGQSPLFSPARYLSSESRNG